MNGIKQITVQGGQSLIDIAMQQYGCYEGVMLLLQDNADRLTAIDNVPDPGMQLNIRTEVPKLNNANKGIAQAFALQRTAVVSSPDVPTITLQSQLGLYVDTGYVDEGYLTAPNQVLNIFPSPELITR